ncbi:MAG TPA: fibronectin type III domain-containing protein, partial [Chloroflexota bacterium]|nr:fibronectin type III domain-containing protein [Chloroflexota bacterium]
AMAYDSLTDVWRASLDTRTLTDGYHHVTVTGQGLNGTSVEDRAWNILVQNGTGSASPTPTTTSSTPVSSPTPTSTAEAGLQAPSGLAASRGGPARSQWIDLSWTGNSPGASYLIERSTDSSFSVNVTSIPVTAGTTSHRDQQNLLQNTTYYYRVFAVSGSQRSAPSNTVSETTK